MRRCFHGLNPPSAESNVYGKATAADYRNRAEQFFNHDVKPPSALFQGKERIAHSTDTDKIT